jgi:hypothetical protein
MLHNTLNETMVAKQIHCRQSSMSMLLLLLLFLNSPPSSRRTDGINDGAWEWSYTRHLSVSNTGRQRILCQEQISKLHQAHLRAEHKTILHFPPT